MNNEAKNLPRFLRDGNATGTPAQTSSGDEPGLPRFLRRGADQSQVIGVLVGNPEHSAAMKNYEGAPDAGTASEAFKSTSKDAKARRARNLRDLAKKGDVIDTSYHPDVE